MRRPEKRYSFSVRCALLLLLLAPFFVSDDANAAEPTPVVVTMHGEGRVRLEVSAGSTIPCDSSANTPLFDGWIAGGQVFNATTTEACVCVRHTSKKFPTNGWSTPGLACRKQICRGRICRPAPDQTIRANLSTHG
jgi:hypothetical protein